MEEFFRKKQLKGIIHGLTERRGRFSGSALKLTIVGLRNKSTTVIEVFRRNGLKI